MGIRVNSQQSAGRKPQSGYQKIKYSSKGREKGEKDLRKKNAKDLSHWCQRKKHGGQNTDSYLLVKDFCL